MTTLATVEPLTVSDVDRMLRQALDSPTWMTLDGELRGLMNNLLDLRLELSRKEKSEQWLT